VRPGTRGAETANVLTAMNDLILASHVRSVVVSYNEEGLLSREEIGSILARFSGEKSFDFEKNFRVVEHRRFRSDSDRRPVEGRGGRAYRVLDGKDRDRIGEWLFYAERAARARRRAFGGGRLAREGDPAMHAEPERA